MQRLALSAEFRSLDPDELWPLGVRRIKWRARDRLLDQTSGKKVCTWVTLVFSDNADTTSAQKCFVWP